MNNCACILIQVSLLVIMVPRTQSYLRPEPPETHFFLAANYHIQARLHRVFFTESASTEAELLCLEETEQLQLELLAHLVCTESGFPTFSSVQTSESEYRVAKTSSVTCSVDPLQEIRCNRQGWGKRWCRPLQISCGGCLRKLRAGPGTSLSLASPLYPHLLPGLVCRWDLEVVEVGSSSQLDLSLEVTDLSLGDEETCETSTSSLHILAGPGREEPLQSEATLCGNQTQHSQGPRYHFTNKKHLQLRFVSGESEWPGERRGFQLTISVSEEKKTPTSLETNLIVFISIVAAAVLLGGLLCCVALGLNIKQAGASRMGRSPASGRQEAANIYMMDNSVARRLPTLPGFRFHSDNNLQNGHEANVELGFKLYETISLKSRINSYENIGVRFQEYCNRVRRVSLASSSIPPPPPLPERPIIVAEETDMSPIYLSFSGEDNQVFEE